jgi:hypothetical protein
MRTKTALCSGEDSLESEFGERPIAIVVTHGFVQSLQVITCRILFKFIPQLFQSGSFKIHYSPFMQPFDTQ